MGVLDTAAKHREELLFDRYRAGHDVIARFTKDPPYAYIIPREQSDRPTAAVLVEKLHMAGIEIHQATKEFPANTTTYKEGDWVVLMDQPFAALVKELFDIQKYPQLTGPPPAAAASGGGRGAGGSNAQTTPAAAGGGRGAGGRGAPGCRGRDSSAARHANTVRRDGLDTADPDGRRGGDRRGACFASRTELVAQAGPRRASPG